MESDIKRVPTRHMTFLGAAEMQKYLESGQINIRSFTIDIRQRLRSDVSTLFNTLDTLVEFSRSRLSLRQRNCALFSVYHGQGSHSWLVITDFVGAESIRIRGIDQSLSSNTKFVEPETWVSVSFKPYHFQHQGHHELMRRIVSGELHEVATLRPGIFKWSTDQYKEVDMLLDRAMIVQREQQEESGQVLVLPGHVCDDDFDDNMPGTSVTTKVQELQERALRNRCDKPNASHAGYHDTITQVLEAPGGETATQLRDVIGRIPQEICDMVLDEIFRGWTGHVLVDQIGRVCRPQWQLAINPMSCSPSEVVFPPTTTSRRRYKQANYHEMKEVRAINFALTTKPGSRHVRKTLLGLTAGFQSFQHLHEFLGFRLDADYEPSEFRRAPYLLNFSIDSIGTPYSAYYADDGDSRCCNLMKDMMMEVLTKYSIMQNTNTLIGVIQKKIRASSDDQVPDRPRLLVFMRQGVMNYVFVDMKPAPERNELDDSNDTFCPHGEVTSKSATEMYNGEDFNNCGLHFRREYLGESHPYRRRAERMISDYAEPVVLIARDMETSYSTGMGRPNFVFRFDSSTRGGEAEFFQKGAVADGWLHSSLGLTDSDLQTSSYATVRDRLQSLGVSVPESMSDNDAVERLIPLLKQHSWVTPLINVGPTPDWRRDYSCLAELKSYRVVSNGGQSGGEYGNEH